MSLSSIRFAAISAALATISALFCTMPARGQESVEIGYVRSFEGIAENYKIFRQNELMDIKFFLPVNEQDVVLLQADQGRVELSLGSANTVVRIETEHFPCPIAPEDWEPSGEPKHSPCPIPSVERPPTIPHMAYEEFGRWLSERNDYQVITGRTMGAQRDLALRIPGLATGRA